MELLKKLVKKAAKFVKRLFIAESVVATGIIIVKHIPVVKFILNFLGIFKSLLYVANIFDALIYVNSYLYLFVKYLFLAKFSIVFFHGLVISLIIFWVYDKFDRYIWRND